MVILLMLISMRTCGLPPVVLFPFLHCLPFFFKSVECFYSPSEPFFTSSLYLSFSPPPPCVCSEWPSVHSPALFSLVTDLKSIGSGRAPQSQFHEENPWPIFSASESPFPSCGDVEKPVPGHFSPPTPIVFMEVKGTPCSPLIPFCDKYPLLPPHVGNFSLLTSSHAGPPFSTVPPLHFLGGHSHLPGRARERGPCSEPPFSMVLSPDKTPYL